MKLDYKILWLDDKIQEMFIDDEYINEIKLYLIDEGFQPEIIPVSDENLFFQRLDGSFDLILTDYNLKDVARNGEKIITDVRERNIFTEILFYTAKEELVDTFKKDRISFLETSKFSHQGTHQEVLIRHLKDLIGLTIKKFQHIVAMRGLIMHETSILDIKMVEIIKKALVTPSIDFSSLSDSVYRDLLELYAKKSKFVSECRDNSRFKDLTKDNFVFSADYKIKTLGQILLSLDISDFSDEYKEEINNIRNKFAHSVLQEDAEGRKFFKHGDSGLTFDETLCKKIRRDIIKHDTKISELEERLKKA